MSRKDYQLIAEFLWDRNDGTASYGKAIAAVADALEKDNPRFDRAKFYGVACDGK